MPTATAVPGTGTTMPDIALTAADGSTARLLRVVNGSSAVLFFMRASSCPICLSHVSTLAKMVAAGELPGARVVVITPGDATDAKAVARRAPELAVYASGQEHSSVGLGKFLGLQHSGTFVLDADGTVLAARTATLPTGSFSKDEVLAALA